MGRKFRQKKSNDVWQKKEEVKRYDTIIKTNALFEKYYKQLNLMDESEWNAFIEILKLPLPITFRITKYKSFAQEILHTLKEKHLKYIDEITRTQTEQVREASANKGASLLLSSSVHQENTTNSTSETGELLLGNEIYKCLEWYPDEMAWQVQLSRQDVRKNVHFDEFKQFLIHQTQQGYISRQEAVSMIPPLVLDVKPHHKILDMCASPGSKTAQLIEYLHDGSDENVIPEGFVIANDLENKRCYMLMHQLKRLESPNFMIVNHDASSMPNMRNYNVNDARTSPNYNSNIAYDRILADVPCSGDGTFRKNIDVWTKWNFAHACNLHGIQSRIAKRAVELLAPGGRMVYSTCSLNPVENEAVVYNLLLKFKGQLELVDVREQLKGLKTVKGLLKWNLMTKTGELFDTVEQAEKSDFRNLMRPYMFPPEMSVAQELHLDRCIRILPHHQNTGGFFIAVIRKLPLASDVDLNMKLLTSTSLADGDDDGGVAEEKKNETTTTTTTISGPPEADTKPMKGPPAKRAKFTYDENPFKFNTDDENSLLADWPKIKDFFKISDDFPVEQMMTRNKGSQGVRNVYFVSKQIRDLTVNNGDRIKFINMGVPLFSRAEIKDPSQMELRVCQESVEIAQKYFGNRVVEILNKNDLIKILKESMPITKELSDEFQEQVEKRCLNLPGSLLLYWKYKNTTTVSFTSWLGKASLRPLINVQTRAFYLEICGVDQSEIVEACNKIKAEDHANSVKSLQTNAQYQNKLKKLEQEKQQQQQQQQEKDLEDDDDDNDLNEDDDGEGEEDENEENL